MEQKQEKALFEPPLSAQRYVKIAQIIEEHPDITTIVDVGCGSCALFMFLKQTQVVHYIGIDIDEALVQSSQTTHAVKPNFCDLADKRTRPLKAELFCGNLTRFDENFRDYLTSLKGKVCFVLCEVIEHLYPNDLEKMCCLLFSGAYRMDLVIVTTPNFEFNEVIDAMVSSFYSHCSSCCGSVRDATEESDHAQTQSNRGTKKLKRFRHPDHKFEFTQREFTDWIDSIERSHKFSLETRTGVGATPDEKRFSSALIGYATQIAVFCRRDEQPDTACSNPQPGEQEYGGTRERMKVHESFNGNLFPITKKSFDHLDFILNSHAVERTLYERILSADFPFDPPKSFADRAIEFCKEWLTSAYWTYVAECFYRGVFSAAHFTSSKETPAQQADDSMKVTERQLDPSCAPNHDVDPTNISRWCSRTQSGFRSVLSSTKVDEGEYLLLKPLEVRSEAILFDLRCANLRNYFVPDGSEPHVTAMQIFDAFKDEDWFVKHWTVVKHDAGAQLFVLRVDITELLHDVRTYDSVTGCRFEGDSEVNARNFDEDNVHEEQPRQTGDNTASECWDEDVPVQIPIEFLDADIDSNEDASAFYKHADTTCCCEFLRAVDSVVVDGGIKSPSRSLLVSELKRFPCASCRCMEVSCACKCRILNCTLYKVSNLNVWSHYLLHSRAVVCFVTRQVQRMRLAEKMVGYCYQTAYRTGIPARYRKIKFPIWQIGQYDDADH